MLVGYAESCEFVRDGMGWGGVIGVGSVVVYIASAVEEQDWCDGRGYWDGDVVKVWRQKDGRIWRARSTQVGWVSKWRFLSPMRGQFKLGKVMYRCALSKTSLTKRE